MCLSKHLIDWLWKKVWHWRFLILRTCVSNSFMSKHLILKIWGGQVLIRISLQNLVLLQVTVWILTSQTQTKSAKSTESTSVNKSTHWIKYHFNKIRNLYSFQSQDFYVIIVYVPIFKNWNSIIFIKGKKIHHPRTGKKTLNWLKL